MDSCCQINAPLPTHREGCMSNKYKRGDRVPSDVLSKRLRELANAICESKGAFTREFTMRVPAELDRDADLVLMESARRISELEFKAIGRDKNGKLLPIEPFHQSN